MKKYLMAAAVAAGLSFTGSPAHAAADLVSASVTSGLPGFPTGRVWDTQSANTFYALFLQQPFGTFINPGQTLNDPTDPGLNEFSAFGEGFFPGAGTVDSDPIYTLTLLFADGAELTGTYMRSTQTFTGSSVLTAGGARYTLNSFTWERLSPDTVRPFDPVPGGDPDDYFGGFSFTAVPEPGTWAMMLLGFGAVGYSMRRRSSYRLAQAV